MSACLHVGMYGNEGFVFLILIYIPFNLFKELMGVKMVYQC